MSGGLGEYLNANAGGLSDQELLATAQPVPMSGTPDGLGTLLPALPAAARQLPRAVSGSVEKAIPLLKDARRLNGLRGVRGLGQEEVQISTVATVALVAVGMVLRAGAGYFAGKAMAPSAQKATVYAWTGAGVALVFGALGLGVQGIVALQSRHS